jgi:hypothetical protein
MNGNKNHPPIDIAELNRRHIYAIDKLYRMNAGLSSSVVDIYDDCFELRVEISQRVPPEKRENLIFNITKSWFSNFELADCKRVFVRVFETPSPVGFSRPLDKSSDDPVKQLVATLREAFTLMKEAEKLPKLLLGEYTGPIPFKDRSDLRRIHPSPQPSE